MYILDPEYSVDRLDYRGDYRGDYCLDRDKYNLSHLNRTPGELWGT